MREPRAAACPGPEDLTALAHGEGRGEARSALIRHVLSCPACRREHAASERILLALRGLGAARASHAPEVIAPARARTLGWGWVPPAVAAAAVALALLVPLGSRPAGAARPPPAVRHTATRAPAAALPVEDVGTLLAAQEPDGRWAAEPGLGGRTGDEAATALVLLALLRPGAGALQHEPLARAIATGSRWLAGHAPGLALGAGPENVRARAVVSAALLRVESLTHDPSLRPAARTLLAAVTRDAEVGADHASRPWLEYALATAGQAGWAGAERDLRSLAAAPRPVEPTPEPGAPDAVRAARAERSPRTPMRLAWATLRDEPRLNLGASWSPAR